MIHLIGAFFVGLLCGWLLFGGAAPAAGPLDYSVY